MKSHVVSTQIRRLALPLIAALLLTGCITRFFPPRKNRVEILSIEPQFLDFNHQDRDDYCAKFNPSYLGDLDSMPEVIGLKLNIRYFSDSTESSYQYTDALGYDGLADTLAEIRIGIKHANGQTFWWREPDWKPDPYGCIEVVKDKPIFFQGNEMPIHNAGPSMNYQTPKELRRDLNRYAYMPRISNPVDGRGWIRVFLFPKPADSIPLEGKLVVELDFASGRQLVGSEQ